MDNGMKDILMSITSVRTELSILRERNADKSEQLECFKRLIALYGLLNVEKLSELVKEAA